MSNNEIDQAIREKRLYFIGERLPADWYEAFRLCLPLAEAGDAKAQFNIGRCYSTGDGVDKNETTSLQWLMKAANQNDPRAHYNIYLHHNELKNLDQAETWLNKAVELGEPRALITVGKKCLLLGDKDKARALFQQALNAGYKSALLGITACDAEISFHTTTVKQYSSGGSYTNPALVFKAKNNSSNTATLSVWIQNYDKKNPDKKMGDARRLDLPPLQPGESSEVIEELHLIDKAPFCVCFTAYTVWASRHGDYEEFEFPTKKLAWDGYKSSCFILTACYGDHDAPTVLQYRQFRDNHLANHEYGRRFISWYYTHGPKWADQVAQMPKTKAVLRQIFKAFALLLPR